MAAPAGAEDVSTLFDNRQARIERIVSRNHVSPPGFWYDQDADEWVLLLRGSATLEFDNGSAVELHAGDYLTIPSHVRHRVARTDAETVWLAVHLSVAS
jgi:cupin 2 domain-containing protein